jgi:hypothetical protein
MVFLEWFFNTFKIVFTQKIQRMDSFIYFNFFSFILLRVTFHLELRMFLMQSAS